jgi:hypothetical protein
MLTSWTGTIGCMQNIQGDKARVEDATYVRAHSHAELSRIGP